MKKLFAGLLAVLVCAPTLAYPKDTFNGNTGAFAQLKIGGGGFVTRFQAYSDGTQIARTDTAGANIRDNYKQVWRPLLTVTSMPSPDNGLGMVNGVCEIAAAPSNTSILYMYFTPNTGAISGSYIYKSTNKGQTWARTDTKTFPRSNLCDPNDQAIPSARLKGPYMAVSPANANVMYIGTPSNGVYYTLDGGTSYTHISTSIIPGGSTPSGADKGQGNLIVFDPSDATGNTVYISSYGTGLYRCTAALTSPSCALLNSTGMPSTYGKLTVAQDGVVWVVDDTGSQQGNLWRYQAGIWSEQVISGNRQQLACVAVSPTDPTKVYAVDYVGFLTFSVNAEAAKPKWNGPGTVFETSSIIGWMQWSNDTTPPHALSVQSCQFDPAQTNVLYGGTGVGVFTTNPPTTAVTPAIAWNGDQSQGIENLDATAGLFLDSGILAVLAQDRPLFQVSNLAVYPSRYYPNNAQQIVWGTNTCKLGSTMLITTKQGLVYSTDGGITYSRSYNTSGAGGSCAAFDNRHWLWASANDIGPLYTADGGNTYSPCTFTGATGRVTAAGGGWNHNYQYNRNSLAQDTVSPTTVMLWNDGSGGSNGTAARGIWRATLGGASCTFTLVYSGAIGRNPAAGMNFVSVPGQSCNALFTPYSYVHGTLPDDSTGIYLSTDCGASWSAAIPNVQSILASTFGATKPGASYPTFYCACWVYRGRSLIYGIWESDNINQARPTFTQIGDGYPAGNYDLIMFLVGDMNTYGTVYGGNYGSGFFYRTLH